MKFNKTHKELATINNIFFDVGKYVVYIGGSGYGHVYSTLDTTETTFFCAYNFEVYLDDNKSLPQYVIDKIQSYYRQIRRRSITR